MNQRSIFTLLAVIALGYVGYVLWSDHGVEWLAKLNPPLTIEEATPAPVATPAPITESKPPALEAVPAENRFAPPGIYYMLERVSVQTDRGVKAVNVGEEVKLMMRKSGGVIRVTVDGRDFDVKEGQVTNDLHLLRQLVKAVPASRGTGN